MWTEFFDMHSGGGCKEEPFEKIYIEAPKDEAMIVFYNRFGHNPERVTCTCCGEDYSIYEKESLEEHERKDNILVIRAEEIKPEERQGSVRRQGYVWVD